VRKLWDLLALFVSFIFSIILWFTFFKGTFTISTVIDTSIVWILGVAIISIGAKFIGWILGFFDIAYVKAKAMLEEED
jgi:hypothetical protein